MNTYNQLIHEYRKLFKEKGLPPETVKAFLFELCNDHDVNLYLDIDKPMKKEVYDLFVRGRPCILLLLFMSGQIQRDQMTDRNCAFSD